MRQTCAYSQTILPLIILGTCKPVPSTLLIASFQIEILEFVAPILFVVDSTELKNSRLSSHNLLWAPLLIAGYATNPLVTN
jgi:hypothetical protein